MPMRNRYLQRLAALLLLILTATPLGCGPSNKIPTETDLRRNHLLEAGELLRMFQVEKGAPPKSLQDLQSLPNLEMAAPMGAELIRTGEILVRWNAALPDTGEEPGTTPHSEVLAYLKEVPEQGGLVLLLNRTVKEMTAAEFQAAPKAGTDPATP